MFRLFAAICVFAATAFLIHSFIPSVWFHGINLEISSFWSTGGFFLFRWGMILSGMASIVTFSKLK